MGATTIMHKNASRMTGGDSLTGWSTAKSTAPTDYRNLKRWKPVPKKRISDRGKEGALQAFIGVQIARIRLGKPLAFRMAESVRRDVIAAGGLVAWAKRQPALVEAAANAGTKIHIAGYHRDG